MSSVIFIRGIPGSGKSYIAEALQTALGEAVIVDPDAIDTSSPEYRELAATLASEGVDEKFYPYRFLRTCAYNALLAGKTVIWNQAFNNLDGFNLTVQRFREFADAHGKEVSILLVEVEIDPEIARRRVSERVASGLHDVPAENMRRFIDEYQSFAGKTDFRTVRVDGQDAIENIVTAVREELG